MEFDISNSIERFQEHIAPKENDRIIFSGKFGAGKTYFLNNFFEEIEEEYCSIHLFPINYSVASNEDIFELIKFDILFHLLEQGASLEKEEDISHEIFLYFYLHNKTADLATALLRYIPKIGPYLEKGSEKVLKLIQDYQKEYEKSNEDRGKLVKEFLERIKEQKSSIYEEDAITLIIKDLVDSLREKDDDGNILKSVVLIVDDLDRIDPGHLFRILNVLSAHTDRYEEGDNKFGFDKIILTFDLENVKNIYHHQYGEKTDFGGYIDKFYTGIFRYHLIEGLMNQTSNILTGLKPRNTHGFDFTLYSTFIKGLSYIISNLIQSRLITIRNIKLFNDLNYEIPNYYIHHPNIEKTKVSRFDILVYLDLLLRVKPTLTQLMSSIENTIFEEGNLTTVDFTYSIVNSILPILGIEDNRLICNKKIYNVEIVKQDVKMKITYNMPSLERTGKQIYARVEKVEVNNRVKGDSDGSLGPETYKNLFKLLLPEVINFVKEKNLLANRPN